MSEYVSMLLLLPKEDVEQLARWARLMEHPGDVEDFAIYLLREAAASMRRRDARAAKKRAAAKRRVETT